MRVPPFVVVLAALACGPRENDTLDLIGRLEQAPPSERDHLVRDAIKRNGGAPIVEGDSALFFVERGPEGPSPRLLADFNGWGEPDERLAETRRQ